MQQLILDIRPDARPGFDNYLPGANLEPVQALMQRLGAAAADGGEHVLYLWGEAGVGKSHLLRAWSAASAAPYLAHGTLPTTQGAALLAVDDVEGLDEAAQMRLFALLNSAREQGGRILAAGTQPPAQLALRPELSTRLAQGLVYRLHPLTDADKALAIATRAEALGMNMPAELSRYMLLHCRRDLPHLLDLVDRLDALCLSRKRPVSLSLLKDMLRREAALPA